MTNHKMFIFHATDYINYPLGGTLGTIKNYLKYSRFDCYLVGITREKREKIGEWRQIDIDGVKYDLIYIAHSQKEIIPHKLLMLIGIIRFARKIMKKCPGEQLNAMLFVNRECYLPIRYVLGLKKQVHVIFKMTEAVNSLTTSGRKLAGFTVIQNIYQKIFIDSLLRGASLIFAINKQCRQFCEQTLLKNEERQKIIDVHHYVDYEKLVQLYNDAEEEGKRKKRLIFWGRLAVVKGLELLLNGIKIVLKKGNDVELLIIGEGNEKMKYEKIAEQLNIKDRVQFVGQCNIDEIASLSKNSDLFVMSSHSEGIPTSMLEAMCFGLPLLSTAVGGVPSLITDGENGYMVTDRDEKKYAEGLVRCLNMDKEKAKAYSQRYIQKHFSAKSVVQTMDHYILKAIDKKKK